MAHLTPWVAVAMALLPPLAAGLLMSGRGSVGQRFVAMQFVGSIGVSLLVVLTFALDQASSIDLALTLALLAWPATLLFAIVLERWL